METTRHFHLKEAEEMEAVKRENEELKDVLSAVQLDLEAKTEVGRGRVGGRLHLPFPGPSWSWCGGVTLVLR